MLVVFIYRTDRFIAATEQWYKEHEESCEWISQHPTQEEAEGRAAWLNKNVKVLNV